MFVPNLPDEVSLLALGVAHAREAEAGGMTEVPQAQGLAEPARSAVFYFLGRSKTYSY
jgi:hypothetical protein